MINEAQKQWRREPSDEEWHEIFHKNEADRRCKYCQSGQAALLGRRRSLTIDRNLFVSADGWSYDGVHPVPSEEVTQQMLDLLDLKPGEKVLEIGTGSGYQAACLAETGAEVFTMDAPPARTWYPALPDKERENVMRLVTNGPAVLTHVGDGRKGWPYVSERPFDAIVITCGMEDVPAPLIDQLKEHGRLVAPIGNAAGQELTLFTKENGELKRERVASYVRFVMCEEQPQ